MDNLPDLPTLESVETRSQGYLPIFGIMMVYFVPLALSISIMFIYYRQYMGLQAWVLCGIITALMIWVAVRLLSGHFYYKTDSMGITFRGPLQKKTIAWGQINKAYTKEATCENIIIIETIDGKFTLTPRSASGTQGDLIIASIRQHLARFGKAVEIALPNRAQSLWDTIPDDLPREIDWKGPSRLGDLIGLAITTLMFGVLVIPLWIASKSNFQFILILLLPITIAMFFLLRFLIFPSILRKAFSVTLRDDYIEAALAFGKVTLLWSDVTSAYLSAEGIVIASNRDHKEIKIPWLRKNDDSGKLILAIIRRLRTADAPIALTIPDALRSFDSVPANGDTAELRLSRSEVRFTTIFFGAFGCIMAIAMALEPRYTPVGFAIICAITALWFLIAGRLIGSYYIRIDPEGFTRGFLGLKQFISWNNVALLDWSPTGKAMRLKNAKGKTLTEFSLGFGNEQERARFNTLLRTKLDHNDEPAKPWLARPIIDDTL